MVEVSWKSVSEPRCNGSVRIDYEGQNLVAGVTYEGLITVPSVPIIEAHGTQIFNNNPIGYSIIQISWLESFGCTFPLEIKVHLQTDLGVVKDTVTRTIPEKPTPPNFEFVEEECFIRYGDDLFCFADETKDIPPGTNIWAYFKVKNTGETASRLTTKVFDGDTKMCEKSPLDVVQPGESITFYTHCFNMSDTNRDLVMKVYEYGKTEELDSLGCK